MEKGFMLDFNNDVTLEEIFNELMNYKKQGIIASCTYHDVRLSNENEEELRLSIDRLKTDLYNADNKTEQDIKNKKIMDYKIYTTMISAPKLLKYYVERGALFLSDEQAKNSFIVECYYWYGKNQDYFKSIKIASKLLEAIYTMNCGNNDLAGKIIDKLMNSLNVEDECFFDIAEIVIKKTLGDSSQLYKLILRQNFQNTQEQYEGMLNKEYPKSIK